VKRWLLVAIVACGHPPPAKTMKVSDDRATARIEKPVAVAELGDATFVFAPTQATILRRGTVLATAPAPDGNAWIGGATIAAPDGEGRWAVGVGKDGTLWRVTLGGEIEPVSDRLGLGGKRVRELRAVGTTFGAALDDGSFATSRDGLHVAIAREIFARDRSIASGAGEAGARDTPVGAFAVARDRIALNRQDGVELWDLARAERRTYPFAELAIGTAFVDADTDHARLVVATQNMIYVERDGRLRAQVAPALVTALAAAGARAWIATASGLYVLDRDALVHTDAPAMPGALYGSPTGGVWIAGARLAHYEIDVAAQDVAWQDKVQPVFQRVCSHCHLPGGDAGIDLSTVQSWQASRAEIARRVLVTRTMPPAGTELSDADRAALQGWLETKK
jgi:mono/diheme cytochrome c family protein